MRSEPAGQPENALPQPASMGPKSASAPSRIPTATAKLLVEQNAQMALQVAGRGYILQTGKIILADTSAALAANEQVKKAYLGA